MRKWAIILIVALVATAAAAPKRKKKPPKKKPPVEQPVDAGSGSGSGSGSAAATPDPTPPPPPPPPAPPATPIAAPGAGGPPGASLQSGPPLPAPRLAMRKAHDGFVDNMDCSACHTADGWNLAAQAGQSGFDHDKTGFPLRGAHTATTCTSCHTGGPKPATTCEGCHRDPHAGRHVGTCAECHNAVAWSDTTALEQHRRTRMPLTGRHAMIDCSDCHKRQGERQFSDTPADCFACHSKDYHNATVHPTHDGSTGQAPFPRDCGLCHQTSSWTPAYQDPSKLPRLSPMSNPLEHDRFFTLSTGSHRTADCASCHTDQRRPQLVRCDGCHNDVTLRAQHKTPVSRAATACIACHPRGAAR